MSVKAAGLIIYRRIGEALEYLLLQASRPEFHWTPPKGHLDSGENELEAALRETQEEAGLASDSFHVPNQDFKIQINYIAFEKPKVVTYWIAQLKNPNEEIKLSHEHQAYRWCNFDEALSLARYETQVDAFKQAHAHICSTKNEYYQ